MVIVPLLDPQVASVGVTATALGPFVLAMLAVVENVHPLPSTEYVYGDVPPVTDPIVIVPLLAPQATLVGVTATADGPFALPMFAVVENVHPFASFTLIVCEPAPRLL